MNILQKLFDFYVLGNIHVALGVFCFVKITLMPFGINENETALFIFFSTILSYNFIRFLNIPIEKNWISKWVVENKIVMLIVSGISAVFCVYFIIDFSFESIVILFPFVVLTFFYGKKLPNSMISLRKIPGLKIILIAICFAGITVLFPLVKNGIEVTLEVWLLFLQRLIFVMVITIPFDIRDVAYDCKRLKTIPQYFGVKAAKIIGVLLGVLVVLIEWSFLFRSFEILLVTIFISLLSIVLLIFSSKNQSKYYSSFWVESIPIIWFVVLLIESKI